MDEEKNNERGIFPKCTQCEGSLVPFSFKEDVFEKWKCTKCGYTIRKNP
jgi:DNA-directed RNA polymerase subunit M/transcription elongation factor TFIIS